MDRKAMYKLSYGLFILTAKEAGWRRHGNFWKAENFL